MTRLVHCLGRWRGTRCDTCGGSVKGRSSEVTTGSRCVHLPGQCAKGGTR